MHVHVFLSYTGQEESLASGFRRALEDAFIDTSVFVSAESIRGGDQWFEEVRDNIHRADAILALCSPYSVHRPWVNFESGCGFGRKIPVVSMAHSGLTKESLPYPFSVYQGFTFPTHPDRCGEMLEAMGKAMRLTAKPHIDWEALGTELLASLTDRPKRKRRIALDLTTGQKDWRTGSLFDLHEGKLFDRLGQTWDVERVTDPALLRADRIHQFAGVLQGSPFRSAFTSDRVASLQQFVTGGGRLLLLGYELGDRHHGANMRSLAERFGIYPASDIVGPAKHDGKPYGAEVQFASPPTEAHPLVAGLDGIRMTNVQTLLCEPGARPLLAVGENWVYRPTPEGTRYHQGGGFSANDDDFSAFEDLGSLPVAAQAPQAFCGKGSVIVLGTWDLLGAGGVFLETEANRAFLTRLFDWLSQVPAAP